MTSLSSQAMDTENKKNQSAFCVKYKIIFIPFFSISKSEGYNS